jgi:hypothetical protein
LKKIFFFLVGFLLVFLGAPPGFADSFKTSEAVKVPWDTDYQDFLKAHSSDFISKYRYEMGDFASNWAKKYLIFDDKQTNIRLGLVGYLCQIMVGEIEGYKISYFKDEDEMNSFDLEIFKDCFDSVYIKGDRTAYCFYQGKLFARVVPLEDEEFDEAGADLRKKYGTGTPFAYPLCGELAVWTDRGHKETSGWTYRLRGKKYPAPKGTTVFLVKVANQNDGSGDYLFDQYGVVYQSDAAVKALKADFKKRYAAWKAESHE